MTPGHDRPTAAARHPGPSPLDRRALLEAVRVAQRAPSVHNTQPWRWHVAPGRVQLFADPERALPATDPTGRELLISCGAVLHHLVVVLRAAGLAATVHRFPDPAVPHLLADLHLHPTSPRPDDLALAGAARVRRTDRRPYAEWPVPPGWWHVLATSAVVHRARFLRVEDDARWTVGQLVDAAAAQWAAAPGVPAETAAWSGRSPGAPDGVPAGAVPRWPDDGDLAGRDFLAAELELPPGPLPHRDGAQLGVLATVTDGALDHLLAGEALSTVLLHATAAGFATHTISEVVEVEHTRRRLAHEVFEDGQVPQVLVRVGWSPSTGRRGPVTGRRPVEETVDGWDDQFR